MKNLSFAALLFFFAAVCHGQPATPVDARPVDANRYEGVLVPSKQYRLSFPHGGRVESVDVEEGERVKAGDRLASLDDSQYRIELERAKGTTRAAEARLALLRSRPRPEEVTALKAAVARARTDRQVAEIEYARATKLSDQGAVGKEEVERRKAELVASQSQEKQAVAKLEASQKGARSEEVEIAKAELLVAQAEIKAVELKIENCLLRAPAEGTILAAEISAGEVVESGAAFFEIADLQRLEAVIHVPAAQFRKLTKGKPCMVSFPAFPGKDLPGRLHRTGLRVDAATRTVRVNIKIDPAKELTLLPGMAAIVKFREDPLSD